MSGCKFCKLCILHVKFIFLLTTENKSIKVTLKRIVVSSFCRCNIRVSKQCITRNFTIALLFLFIFVITKKHNTSSLILYTVVCPNLQLFSRAKNALLKKHLLVFINLKTHLIDKDGSLPRG